jgi:ketosteroid isomerase-like protein
LTWLIVISTSFSQDKILPPALTSLVEAERAFARTSVEKGVREAFITFFADDGINFQPHPTKTKEAFMKRPAPANPLAVTLDWEPTYADVSASGDLGYTTGPFSRKDNSPQPQPTRYGFYFSIWKKQSDGSWKVALDCGIQTPSEFPQPHTFTAARQIRLKPSSGKINPDAERSALMELDRQFLKAAQANGLVKATMSFFNDDARLHRNGVFPVIGKSSIRAYFSEKNLTATWEPMYSDMATLGDLGYTYGSYEVKEKEAVEKGYYVRVWKRQAGGEWKVVLDTTNPSS